jgi:hypothetical protein
VDQGTSSDKNINERNNRTQRGTPPASKKKPGRKQKERPADGEVGCIIGVCIRHYFPDFNKNLKNIPDFRSEDMSTYSVVHLLYLGLLMFFGHCGSRRQLRHESKTKAFHKNLLTLIDEDEEHVADPDTMNYFLERLESCHLEEITSSLTHSLIRKRVLDRYRFEDQWRVALDATKIYNFKERHCPFCTQVEHSDGNISYFHYVLEAKLVAGDFCFSLGTEFIENPDEPFDKQDCELKPAYRLLPKLKDKFPRLPICLLTDALYLNQNIIDICEKFNWSYFITFKEGAASVLIDQALTKIELKPENSCEYKKGSIHKNYSWATDLEFKGHTVHALFCEGIEHQTEKKFAFVTDLRPNKENVRMFVNQGGRTRWKIENQGFNSQKNNGFELTHTYGLNDNAWKNYYFLAQIAHTLQQLYLYSDLHSRIRAEQLRRADESLQRVKEREKITSKTLVQYYSSIKNSARRLFESFRNIEFSIDLKIASRIQVRLNSS